MSEHDPHSSFIKTPQQRLGDKAAWAPRLARGMDALVQSVLKGKGAMPPKAGNASLNEAQVRAAVEFMTSQSK